ncbi:Branched-chain amino acid transport protein (AzlD) [Polynucleobacter meluiroseus]|uniref:Branched-chain amino acid transport protein (AzlD) n=1 Tax=Polynucleobacter meluiroseus TaxID=1938814 RepID=A0A240E1W0_9BURK|nr:AzlD domain-containing protein [Polynucleobacter meluiroseus]SNX29217.1 Branched-chain amino acid transport protein (AzlD) [Polynucleobacter meluiroseus]
MHDMLQGWSLWLALIGACVGTYFCRAIGVFFSKRIDQNSEIFRWLAAVTYAMVAALTVRMILLPIGLLDTVPVWIRIGVSLLSVAVMISSPQRRLVPALCTGTLLLVSYGVMR